jgi:hypothetical protein
LGNLATKWQNPQKLEKSVRKTLKGKRIIVPGFLANVMSGVLRVLPRGTAASIYNKVGKTDF